MKILLFILLINYTTTVISQKVTIDEPQKVSKQKIDSVKNQAKSDFKKGSLEYYVDASQFSSLGRLNCYHSFITNKTGVKIKHSAPKIPSTSLKDVYANTMNQLVINKYGKSFYKKWHKKAHKYCYRLEKRK